MWLQGSFFPEKETHGGSPLSFRKGVQGPSEREHRVTSFDIVYGYGFGLRPFSLPCGGSDRIWLVRRTRPPTVDGENSSYRRSSSHLSISFNSKIFISVLITDPLVVVDDILHLYHTKGDSSILPLTLVVP